MFLSMIKSLRFGPNIMQRFNKYPAYARAAIMREIQRMSDELTAYSLEDFDVSPYNEAVKRAKETGVGLGAAISDRLSFRETYSRTICGGKGRRSYAPFEGDVDIVLDFERDENGERHLKINIHLEGEDTVHLSANFDQRRYFENTFRAYWSFITIKRNTNSEGGLKKLQTIDSARAITHASAAMRIHSMSVVDSDYMIPEGIAKKLFTFMATLYPSSQNVMLRDIIYHARGRDLRFIL